MSLTQLDKAKIMGILRGKVIQYDDLGFDTRSDYDVDELLDVIINLLYNAFETKKKDNFIINALNGIDRIIEKYISWEYSLDEYFIDRLKPLEDKYNEFLAKNEADANIKDNPIIRALIMEIKEDVFNNSTMYQREETSEEDEELSDIKEENDQPEESKEELIEKIQNTLLSMQEEIDTYKVKIKSLEKTLSVQDKKAVKKEKTIESQNQELKDLRKKYHDLTKKYDKLTKSYETLQRKSNEQDKTIEHLKSTKEAISSQLSVANKQNAEFSSFMATYKSEQKQAEKHKIIETEILRILSERSATAEEISRLIERAGLIVSPKNVYEGIMRLKSRVNITSDKMRNFSPVYSLSPKKVVQNKMINLSTSLKVVDLLLISDLHLGLISNHDKKVFDHMYDYCAKHNINLILDLGDLFSYYYQSGSTKFNRIHYNERILETAIKELPHDKNIRHAVLGANHEKKILEYGIDPIDILASSRSDFVNLGYDHAVIVLQNDRLMLHHFNKRIPGLLEGEPSSNKEILEILSQYYTLSSMDRSDTYIDLFGHFHKSLLNVEEGYALVPSLMADHERNGAWHIKVYFDDLGKIDYINFIPIVYNNRLSSREEKVYKKVK